MNPNRFITLGHWHDKQTQKQHPEKIILNNPEIVRGKIQKMIIDGSDNFQIVSDFDHTITSFNFNNKHALATFSVFRESEISPASFKEGMTKLFETYFPIEKDQTIKLEKKKLLMNEWYSKVNDEFRKVAFTRAQSENILLGANIALKPKFEHFFLSCFQNQIPYYIISGGIDLVCGTILNSCLDINEYRDLYLVANRLIFVEDTISHIEMEVTSTSKSQKLIEICPDSRDNIMLLGDLPTDYYMTSKLENINQLAIGFVSEACLDELEEYTSKFDIVILGEPSYLVPLLILSKILKHTLLPADQELLQGDEYKDLIDLF